MFPEMAIGDSYGAGFEYADGKGRLSTKAYHKRNDLSRYWAHPKWGQAPAKDDPNQYIPTRPGDYTDDTQMGIALAEFMLSEQDWTPLTLANGFVEQFKRDPRPGYAGGFYKLLQEVQNGTEFLDRIQPHSNKSGGAMRAPVLGLLPDTQTVIDRAMWQASLTHATFDGMVAAAASALMTHYCYYDIGPKTKLPWFLDVMLGHGRFNAVWQGRVLAPGMDSVRAALTSIMLHDSMSDILKQCIAWTGDVDTVAAIAMPAASLCSEVEDDLPDVLIDGLEDDDYGRTYLTELDARLFTKFPHKSKPNPKLWEIDEAVLTAEDEVEDDGILGMFGDGE